MRGVLEVPAGALRGTAPEYPGLAEGVLGIWRAVRDGGGDASQRPAQAPDGRSPRSNRLGSTPLAEWGPANAAVLFHAFGPPKTARLVQKVTAAIV
jgi:hypothetical protein